MLFSSLPCSEWAVPPALQTQVNPDVSGLQRAHWEHQSLRASCDREGVARRAVWSGVVPGGRAVDSGGGDSRPAAQTESHPFHRPRPVWEDRPPEPSKKRQREGRSETSRSSIIKPKSFSVFSLFYLKETFQYNQLDHCINVPDVTIQDYFSDRLLIKTTFNLWF